jgi:hypothetical protein
MPHLMFEWLVSRAERRWPGRLVSATSLDRVPSVPWQREGADKTRYASFAEWQCPVNCIEPAVCPAIAGPRTWSMPRAVGAYVDAEREAGRALAGPVILQCAHRAYGVGMFETSAVVAGDRVVAAAGAAGPAQVLIATVSHCHGAWAQLRLG